MHVLHKFILLFRIYKPLDTAEPSKVILVRVLYINYGTIPYDSLKIVSSEKKS